ncbi:LysR family transcriptional regulator [Cryptosporangium sp. NPDC048952]|uniref:LysR family transcriptional regulator n=1 Tax=Cryptosporangium sp. NPDC048952 TaxID=3363961 RepID=UPI0037122F2D
MTDDLDLRLVRCFLVVVEHGHLGRAAAQLHLVPSSLSRQITRLEQQVGARLLRRTPQGTRLTAAGETFLPLARAVLDASAQAVLRTKAAAEPNRVTIGYADNLIVTPAVRELRRRRPDADVRTLHVDWRSPQTALLDHRVDAVVARLPFPTEELRIVPLYVEPRVLLVPDDHRLVGKDSVTLDDIADEPMPRVLDPARDAFWRVDPRPDGSRAPDGPVIDDVQDKTELVAGGLAVAIIPGNLGIHRPGLTTIPLEGVEPSQVVLATRVGDRNSLLEEFRELMAAR